MKKILILTALSITFACASFAQRIKHGVGTGFFVEEDDYYDSQVGVLFTYSPALFFAEGEKTSFSIGIPISLGVSSSTYGNYYYSNNGSLETHTNIMLDIPAMINFNYGAGAKAGGKQKMGFFVGAGFGYHYSPIEYFYYDQYGYTDYGTDNREAFGITSNAGLRIGMGRHHRHNLEIKMSYLTGLTGYKPQMFTTQCLFNF